MKKKSAPAGPVQDKSVLVLRRRADGHTRIEGEAPEWHEFSARWIERELGELVEVRVVVRTSEGEVEYELEGFADIHHPEQGRKPNFTGWRCRRRRES